MIKLIAADMDGTLLNSRKELPADFFPLLEQINQKGARFVVASGRQYYSLLRCFDGREKDISYICENGALIFDGGDCLFADEIEKEKLCRVLEKVNEIPEASVVLCGVNSAYIRKGNEAFAKNVEQYYPRCQQVEDLPAVVERDRICKLAVFRAEKAETTLYPELRQFSNEFLVSLSGNSWVDLMNIGVNKGSAMRLLQKAYGASPEECMAFGDYLNDCELLQSCRYGYAMANAHPMLKLISNYEAPSNDENGVVRVIRERLGLSISCDQTCAFL